MAALDAGQIYNILNALLPTGGTAGYPASFTSLSAGVMYMRWDSTAPTVSAAGTQLSNGNGGSTPSITNYASPGISFTASSTPASGGTYQVTLPTVAWSSVAPSGGWSAVYGLDIYSSAAVRVWYGSFNGAPIAVAYLNTFQIAANAVTVSLS